MKRNYYLLRSLVRMGEGLYGLEHIRWGRQMWTLCKVRKDHVCVMTGEIIEKGKEAYHPITNSGNRYERIAKTFFEANS